MGRLTVPIAGLHGDWYFKSAQVLSRRRGPGKTTFTIKIPVSFSGPRQQRIGHAAENRRHLRKMSLGGVGSCWGPSAVKEDFYLSKFPDNDA